jgi:hypothetical protein
MTIDPSPETGIFICGGASILFSYVMIKASYKRLLARSPNSKADALKFWKEIGGGLIWLAGSLATLAIFIKEYHDKLTHPY